MSLLESSLVEGYEISKSTFTYSKLTTETLEQGVIYVQN